MTSTNSLGQRLSADERLRTLVYVSRDDRGESYATVRSSTRYKTKGKPRADSVCLFGLSRCWFNGGKGVQGLHTRTEPREYLGGTDNDERRGTSGD